MHWTQAGSLFGLEVGVGVLAATLPLARAPLGPLFFRLLGGAAAVATTGGALLPLAAGRGSTTIPVLAGAGVTLLGALLLGARLPRAGRAFALTLALAGALLALGVEVTGAFFARSGFREILGPPAARLVLLLAPLVSGGVVGSVAVSMVLGHWYLVVPTLPIDLLRRMNRYAAGALASRLLLTGGLLLLFYATVHSASLFRPMGLFHLGTRAAVGIAIPLLFSGLVAGTLRHGNTRSATGILYASSILVLIGEAVGLSLWSTSGIPL